MSTPAGARATVPAALELTGEDCARDTSKRRERLARLRDTAPVAFHPHASGGFWVVTSHRDARAVLRDATTYGQRGGHRVDALEDLATAPLAALEAPAFRDDVRPFSSRDARARRRLAASEVESLDPGIRARLAEHIARFTGARVIDLARLTAAVPREVRATLAGVPGAQQDRVIDWIATLAGAADAPPSRDPTARRDAAAALAHYGDELLAHRRRHPGEDFTSDWIAGSDSTAPVSGREVATLLYTLIEVGSATTRAVAATGHAMLFKTPGLATRLRDAPELIPVAVEEMLRLAPPQRCVRRTAERDADLGGQRIAKGEIVTVWLEAAHRDPLVFEGPNSVRLDRAENPHLACSIGGLFTLGASLARLELAILFDELLARFPEMLPAGPCELAATHAEDRVLRLPVHLGRAA